MSDHSTPTKKAPSEVRGAELPPGQRALRRFPRFGTHLARPAPAVPVDPVITVRAPGIDPFDVPLPHLGARGERLLDEAGTR